MRVVLTGSTGFVGSCLRDDLERRGVVVHRLVRPRHDDPIRGYPMGTLVGWDPGRGEIEAAGLEGADAVIHLAGANLAGHRWTAAYKREIMDSRVGTTALLARTIMGLRRPPRVFMVASAVGYYGSEGDAWRTEASSTGDDFLAQVCQKWEGAAEPVRERGVRVVAMRFAPILSGEGGMLARILPVFRLGLGGRLGSGEQWFSWVSLLDALGAIGLLLNDSTVDGPVNITSPNPVSNARFTKLLASRLGRPAMCRVPGFVLRMVFGEMADGMLLGSIRASSEKLSALGYSFRHATLEQALEDVV